MKLLSSLLQLPIISSLLKWSKTTTIKGFKGVTIYDVATFFLHELKRDAVIVRASAISFNFMMASFPTLIFLFTLIPYLPLKNVKNNLLLFFKEFLPTNANKIVIETIEDLDRPRGGLLSLGVVLTLFFASNALKPLMKAFDKSHHKVFVRRNVFQLRWIAIQLVFQLMFLSLIASILMFGGNWMINKLDKVLELGELAVVFLTAARWIITIIVIYTIISFLYRKGSSAIQKIPYINPGAISATALSLITSLLFSFYVNNFGQYNKIYGSIGTLIVLLLWIQINAVIIIVGYELNISILVNSEQTKRSKLNNF